MLTKVCKKCKLDLDVDEFFKNKNTKDGLHTWCKSCYREYQIKYYAKNKIRIIEASKNYDIKNQEKVRERNRKHYIANREKLLLISKENSKRNTMLGQNNKRKEKQKIYRMNRKVSEYCKQWYIENKEKISENHKQYFKTHLEEFRIYNQKRRALKKSLVSNLTTKQWINIKLYFKNCCCYCGKELPLTQEHFISVSKSGEYSLNNIVPSCQHCNSSKATKDFEIWYPTYEFYSKKREKIILKFLGYSNQEQQLKII